MKNITLSTLKYLLIFIVIYMAVNLWRAPTLPDTPELRYQTNQGRIIDAVAQSHDAPVLVYFWGTWCSICRITTPNVETLHENGTPVITVATRSDSTAELADYLTKNQLDFMVINDLDGQVFQDWQGKVTPSFVILKDGKIHQSFTGIAPLWSLKLRLWMARL